MKNESQQVATTILEQMGGGRFIAMTGACYMSYGDNSLNMRFKGSKCANHLTVKLDPSDTYTMVFGKIRGMDFKIVKEVSGVYNDQLQSVFTSTTGLYTKL